MLNLDQTNRYRFSDTPRYLSKISNLWIWCLLAIISLGVLSNQVSAQNNYRNLILSDQHNEHYLSPYLTRYLETEKITSAKDIITKSFLQSEVLNDTGSLVLLGYNDQDIWLSFGVSNRSKKTQWKIDFGKGIDGQFGFIKQASVFVYNPNKKVLYKYDVSNTQSPVLNLPENQKLQLIIKIENTKALPLTFPLKLISANSTQENNYILSQFLKISLIGMAFFFFAIFVLRLNTSYALLSLYYIALYGLFYIQNHWIVLNSIPTNFDIHIYIIFGISLLALAAANAQWGNKNNKLFFQNPSFFIPTILALICITIGHLYQQNTPFFTFFLTFTPSLFILIFITLYSLMDGQNKENNSTAFVLGWLIFLFGICISTLALSGIIQPVSTAINAYWYALLPQAFFFSIHARQGYVSNDQNIMFSRTIEINESETVTKLKQSKENSEHQRLLKVIEQERRTLTELRKSEARQTEAMRIAKEQADIANKGKSQFLAVVGHEIRTPMTGIMGMVRMLLNSNLTKEQTEYAQTIQDSSDAMLALLNDILDYEKIEQGKMTFEEITFDLHRLIKGVSTLMQGHATQKNITLETIIGDDLPQFMMADPTRLRQVLLNLTGNAIKFTAEGSVKITAEFIKMDKKKNACEIYFSVADEGIGISEKAQKELFRPFTQADKSISRKFGGTGLGLAISNGLINAMDSEININSVEGEGSVFFFTLHMKVGEGAKDNNRPTQQNNSQPLVKTVKNILVVDDNEINQKVVLSYLKNTTYNITTANSAEEALEKINNNPYDLIFMDIELPGINGDEATQTIRSNKNTQSLPIIALTGHVGDEYVSKYLAAGMNGFIAKPIDHDQLIAAIKDIEQGNIKPAQITNDKLSSQQKPVIEPELKTIEKPVLVATKTSEPFLTRVPEPKKEAVSAPTPAPVVKKTPDLIADPVSKINSALTAKPKQLKDTKPKLTPTPTPPLEQKKPEPLRAFPIKKDGLQTTPSHPKEKKTTTNHIEENITLYSTDDITTISAEETMKIINAETLDNLKKHLDKNQVREMVKDVFEKSEEIIEKIIDCIDKGNTTAVVRQCHDLKGMAGNFGLSHLSSLAQDIEVKSKTQPPIILSSLINKLPDAQLKSKAAFAKWLDES